VAPTYSQADLERIRRQIKPEDVEAYRACLPPPEYCPQIPTPKQFAFLMAPHREVFYGGAAGPGKSSGLLMGAELFLHVPGYNALLLRRTFPEINGQDGLIPRLKEWIRPAQAKGLCDWNASEHRLTVRESGATIAFGFFDRDDEAFKFDGLQVQYVGFDELTSFSEFQYTYLFNRCDVRSHEQLSCTDKTRCSVSGSLPARARLATVAYEAAGTKLPAERLSRTARRDDDGESHAVRERGSEDTVNASELLINAVIDDKPPSDTIGLGQKGAEEGCPASIDGTHGRMNLSAERQDLTLSLVLMRPVSSLAIVASRRTVRKG
jgi:hypothetical protein